MISRRMLLGSVASLLVTLTRGWRYPRVSERWVMPTTDDGPWFRCLHMIPCLGGTWRVDTLNWHQFHAYELKGRKPAIGCVYQLQQDALGRWFFRIETER